MPAMDLGHFVVESHDDAEACFNQFGERLERMCLERAGMPLATLAARAEKLIRYIALVRAIGDNSAVSFITAEIAAWAAAIAEHSPFDLMDHTEEKIADNAPHQANRKILNLIHQAGPQGIGKSGLTRRTQEMDSRERDDHLNNLVEGGKVEKFYLVGKSSGRISTRFRMATKGARTA